MLPGKPSWKDGVSDPGFSMNAPNNSIGCIPMHVKTPWAGERRSGGAAERRSGGEFRDKLS